MGNAPDLPPVIVHDVRQGSEEWHTLRLGIPTASAFHRILTPKQLKPSGPRHRYMAELLAERSTGRPYDMGATSWMGRGNDLEDEARRWYEFDSGNTVELVGFVTNDTKTVGGSPDGLVGDDGLIEIKCRSRARHFEVLLGEEEPASPAQVQGLLWLTDRRWCDVVNYCPGARQDTRRWFRTPPIIDAIAEHVTAFAAELEESAGALLS